VRRILITAGNVSLPAKLYERPTAKLIWAALPFDGEAQIWGDEIYFSIPIVTEQEDEAQEVVEVGELGYWPMGQAFCIFFGPTPVSTDSRPRAYSPVNVFGRVVGNAEIFRRVKGGTTVRVVRATDA
jgi:hypothetical protein